MELLKLSQFKLQLRALISEAQELKERERHASEQLRLMVQEQKQNEEEFKRKLAGVSTELCASNEQRQKLDRMVRCLQNDNDLLESQQKELKGTINDILESRESFIKAYEDSTCEMRRAIEARDRKIDILSEKIKARSMWFGSIEKEASSIKQIVDHTHSALSAREEVVAELRGKIDEVSTFAKLFIEKINNLERELRNKELELRKRDQTIVSLEWQLEAANTKKDFEPKIEQIQQDLSVKELTIQTLMSENKELHFEVATFGVVMKKIQDAVTNMNEGDRKIFTAVFEHQENATTGKEEKNEHVTIRNVEEASSNIRGPMTEDEAQNEKENFHDKSLIIYEETTISPEPDVGSRNNSLGKDGVLGELESCSLPSDSGIQLE